MVEQMELSRRIRALGLSRRQIAAHLNVRPSRVVAWLTGWNTCPQEFLAQIRKLVSTAESARRETGAEVRP